MASSPVTHSSGSLAALSLIAAVLPRRALPDDEEQGGVVLEAAPLVVQHAVAELAHDLRRHLVTGYRLGQQPLQPRPPEQLALGRPGLENAVGHEQDQVAGL